MTAGPAGDREAGIVVDGGSVSSRFIGRRALVTGAASGIGRSTVLRLAAEGASVACLDRNAGGLDEVVRAVSESGGSALPVVCDLVDRDAIPPAVDGAVEALGGLDAVCNIAGVGGFWLDADFPLEEWDRLIAINLTATWLICQRALPHLLETGRGAIVNTASTAATDATPYETAYAATKGAIIALTRSLAINHAKAGLRVNCVAPGPIDTAIAAQYHLPPNADRELLRIITPFGAMGRPEDVASVFAFLASDDAAHVNGHVLKVDGGKRA
jgi:NAD(P)-dependent dehydrogenase (short-subunit alcohol dehydrogenase family)